MLVTLPVPDDPSSSSTVRPAAPARPIENVVPDEMTWLSAETTRKVAVYVPFASPGFRRTARRDPEPPGWNASPSSTLVPRES